MVNSMPPPTFTIGYLAEQILRTLSIRGRLVRDQLCQILERPRTTIFDNLLPLIKNDYVKSYSQLVEGMGKGRPPVFFHITIKGQEWIQEHTKED